MSKILIEYLAYFIKIPIIYYYILDDDSEYIPEDREVEVERTNKAARRIQQSILQELRTVVGGAQIIPENVAKDFILQVIIILVFI